MSEIVKTALLGQSRGMPPDNSVLLRALEELRLKLLDLTGRNRLLNFKHSPARSLQFTEGHLEGLYAHLVEGARGAAVQVCGLPEPLRRDWVEKAGRQVRPEPLAWARQNGIPTSYELPGSGSEAPEHDLRVLLYPDDTAKHCRKIEREALLAIEETGANMLFLVLGFLEFPDQQDSDRTFLSPLISIPVAFTKREVGGVLWPRQSSIGQDG